MQKEKARSIVMILLETNTEDELKGMLEENCWSNGLKQMIRERLEFLQGKAGATV